MIWRMRHPCSAGASDGRIASSSWRTTAARRCSRGAAAAIASTARARRPRTLPHTLRHTRRREWRRGRRASDGRRGRRPRAARLSARGHTPPWRVTRRASWPPAGQRAAGGGGAAPGGAARRRLGRRRRGGGRARVRARGRRDRGGATGCRARRCAAVRAACAARRP
eukprot:6546142-Prymnesium_polylepis.1